jgi:hypothetical protein
MALLNKTGTCRTGNRGPGGMALTLEIKAAKYANHRKVSQMAYAGHFNIQRGLAVICVHLRLILF